MIAAFTIGCMIVFIYAVSILATSIGAGMLYNVLVLEGITILSVLGMFWYLSVCDTGDGCNHV